MIIVETGTGIVGANSYASVADADDFHTLRQNAAWIGATDDQKIAALVRATDYIEARFGARANRLSDDQGLQWPTDATTALPKVIVMATLTLALYALTQPLSAPVDHVTTKSTKKLEGVGELTTEYDATAVDRYPEITGMLAPIASPRGGDVTTGALKMGQIVR
jgi:hypothetical protein